MKKTDLLFYEIMNYPIPKNKEYFSTEKENISQLSLESKEFSRDNKDPLLDEYCWYIAKHQKIFKSLPWIKNIYLCNSITFNKLHPWSDIDLFIVAKKWCLRRARLLSAIIFFILWLKRSKTKIDKKYCLSFYITENAQNLYSISIPNTDIYLAYRLAHLVPLYQEIEGKETIYKDNPRLFSLLPNLPKEYHTINLGLPVYHGNTSTKIKLEKYISGTLWHIVEYLIKTIRIPLLIHKTKKLKEIGNDIIFNDSMLKFYQDKRKKISLLYRTRNTK